MKKKSFREKLQRIHVKRSITAFFFGLIALATLTIPVISLLSGIIAIILALIDFNRQKALAIIAILLSIIAGIVSIMYYKNKPKPLVDPNLGTNVLLGSWLNETVSYEFQDNGGYIQYLSQEITDNYCVGTYAYEYSYTNKDGKIIQSDYDYTYYYVIIKPKYCIINGTKDVSKDLIKEKGMVFGYGNINKSKAVIVNTVTDNFLILQKKDN